jgi:hypothetical protein
MKTPLPTSLEIRNMCPLKRKEFEIEFHKSLLPFFPSYILVEEAGEYRECYLENIHTKYRFKVSFFHDYTCKKMSVYSCNKHQPQGRIYDEKGNKLNWPKISFSHEKGFEKIAADIKKRFLPEFELYNLYLNKQIEKETCKKNIELNIAREISKLLGNKNFDENRSSDHIYSQINGIYSAYINGENITFEARPSLTLEKAARFIEFMRTL